MQKNFSFRRKKGGFLVEVVVSIVILSMGMMVSMVLINDAIRTNAVNRNKIIAINLAREGVEAVRVLRETNWVKYGNNKRICWNFWSNTNEDEKISSSSDDTCTEGDFFGQNEHPIGCIGNDDGDEICENASPRIKSYLLVLDKDNYDWALVENFSVHDSNDFTNLKNTWEDGTLVNGDNMTSWEARKNNTAGLTSRLYLDATTGLYTHIASGNKPTDFYREIFISYPATVDGFFPKGSPALDNQILITSIVWYKGHESVMQKVTIETELTDYLERTEWYE